MNIDPRIVGPLIDIGRAIWTVVTGSSEDRKDAALAIAEAALKAAVEEAQRRAEQLGLVIATMELDLAAQRMITAIRAAAANPTISIPSLLDMEQMPADWKPEPEDPGTSTGDGGGEVKVDGASER